MNTLELKNLALLSTETDEFQTAFIGNPYDERVYLATQSHYLETPLNKGATHKGGSIFCYGMKGNCIWNLEYNDKNLESFIFLIPLKNGMLIAAAKMAEIFEIGAMPKFYAKVFLIDEQGNVVHHHILDEDHYVQLASGIETEYNHFMVFGETKNANTDSEKVCHGWLFQTDNLSCPERLEFGDALSGSIDFIKKGQEGYFSVGIGIQKNANTYSPVVKKLSAAGKIEWEVFASSGKSNETVYSMAIDEADNIYIGSTAKAGQKNILYTYKFDSRGKQIWQSKQYASEFGKAGISLLLKNDYCYVFSVQYGKFMNIHYHCLHSGDGQLISTNSTGPLNTYNEPLISHNKSMLLVAGNGIDEKDNMDIWIDSTPIKVFE